MPEPIDFKQIARTLVTTWVQGWMPDAQAAVLTAQLAAQLRKVWNARGAADIARIEHELSTMLGSAAAGPYVKNLDQALRGLDR
jgi:hypothetical protein